MFFFDVYANKIKGSGFNKTSQYKQENKLLFIKKSPNAS
jgi:hypothetical protein